MARTSPISQLEKIRAARIKLEKEEQRLMSRTHDKALAQIVQIAQIAQIAQSAQIAQVAQIVQNSQRSLFGNGAHQRRDTKEQTPKTNKGTQTNEKTQRPPFPTIKSFNRQELIQLPLKKAIFLSFNYTITATFVGRQV
jgi:hypothetical protein